MEALIQEEVNDVITWMKNNENKPISVNKKFSLAVLNGKQCNLLYTSTVRPCQYLIGMTMI
jgi:hypothetical protein